MKQENLPPERTPPQTYYARTYREGDEQEILKTFNHIFGTRRNLEHWRWKFPDNPFGPIYNYLAFENETDRLVGQYTIMPLALNVVGKRVPMCQSLDTWVVEEFRIQGVFVSLAQECYEACRQAGMALVYGYPNLNSFPGLHRKLGWHRIAFLEKYARRLIFRPGVIVKERLRQLWLRRKLAITSPRLHWSEKLPTDYDRFWNRVRSQEILSVWKDAEYLGWRYGRNPDYAFSFLSLSSEDGGTEAVAVAREDRGHLALHEFMVKDKNIPIARYFISKICEAAARKGLKSVVFYGKDMRFFEAAFRGFSNEPATFLPFCLLTLGPDSAVEKMALNSHNWSITIGDLDSL